MMMIEEEEEEEGKEEEEEGGDGTPDQSSLPPTLLPKWAQRKGRVQMQREGSKGSEKVCKSRGESSRETEFAGTLITDELPELGRGMSVV